MFDRIRWRLTLGYVGILAVILLLFGAVVVVGFRNASARQQDRSLTKEAEVFAGAVARGQPMAEIPMTVETEEYASAQLAADGRVLFTDPTAPELGLPALDAARDAMQRGTTVLATTDGPGGGARLASAPVLTADGVTGVVQLGRSLRAEREAVNLLGLILVPIGLGALVLAGAGGVFMAGRAMAPAKAAFDRQRAFIADASHELKTPLTLIRADAEVHLRGLTDPTERELVEDLLGETERMDAVLSDLLFLARLDAGVLALSREPFDPSVVVRDAAERFAARARVEGKRIEVASGDAPPALGDVERTGQILVALIDNALRFTPAGGRVDVSVTSTDGRVVVGVADHGPGIAPEHVGRVFDRFYRAEAGRSRDQGGTGLGLAIARDLARAQGGDVTLEDAVAGGAVFRLALPEARGANQPAKRFLAALPDHRPR